jgi:hypothetical protein
VGTVDLRLYVEHYIIQCYRAHEVSGEYLLPTWHGSQIKNRTRAIVVNLVAASPELGLTGKPPSNRNELLGILR